MTKKRVPDSYGKGESLLMYQGRAYKAAARRKHEDGKLDEEEYEAAARSIIIG